MKIPGIWGGAASSQALESLPFMAFPYEICCIFAFLKPCVLCVESGWEPALPAFLPLQDQGALSSIPSWTLRTPDSFSQRFPIPPCAQEEAGSDFADILEPLGYFPRASPKVPPFFHLAGVLFFKPLASLCLLGLGEKGGTVGNHGIPESKQHSCYLWR